MSITLSKDIQIMISDGVFKTKIYWNVYNDI